MNTEPFLGLRMTRRTAVLGAIGLLYGCERDKDGNLKPGQDPYGIFPPPKGHDGRGGGGGESSSGSSS